MLTVFIVSLITTWQMALGASGNKTAKANVVIKTAAAKRIPAPRATGNELTDSRNESEYLCLVSVVDDCVIARNNVHLCFTAIQKRKMSLLNGLSYDASTVTLKSATCVKSTDEDSLITWVVRVSDLSVDELVVARGKHADSVVELVVLAVQLSLSMKLPVQCKCVDVIEPLLNHRNEERGERLVDFKANGGIMADGRFNLKKMGSYELKFDKEDVLIELIHTQTADKGVLPACRITKTWPHVDNHDDWVAALTLEAMPPYYLHTAFAKAKNGPYTVKWYTGKPKELQTLVDGFHGSWKRLSWHQRHSRVRR